MRLHEHEAKELLREAGVVVPHGEVVADGPTAVAAAERLGGVVVVKAQVLAGGRGRDGGVQVASNAAEAGQLATAMLARPCRGLHPERILIEEKLAIVDELYAAVTIDPQRGCPVALLGRGGVDVEDRARADGGGPQRRPFDVEAGLTADAAASLVADVGAAPAAAIATALQTLARVFLEQEALTVEVNPLAVLADGSLAAADAVIELDDAARELAGKPLRDDGVAARERSGGMTFVELGGDIGLVCSGAGLGMATMDLIAERATPANFLETGGGISRELMRKALERVLACPGLRGVLINIYGGINPIHEGALGVADVMPNVKVPVVAKALGNRQEETWATLEAAGVTVVRELSTEHAVEVLLDQVEAAL